MIGGHHSAEVGGGEVLGFGMPRKPFAAQAVGDAREHGVQSQGLGIAQPATVVLARGVEPGVESGFDAPVGDVGLKPLLRREFGRRAAGDQANRFGFASRALAIEPGDLRGAWKEQFLARGRCAHQLALHPFAFLFLAMVPGAATGMLFGHKRGEPGSGSFDSMRFFISGVFSLMVSE